MNKLFEMIFSTFQPSNTEFNDMTATIVPTDKGFGLFTRTGLIGDYTRERDAKRGAARRGFTIA